MKEVTLLWIPLFGYLTMDNIGMHMVPRRLYDIWIQNIYIIE